MKNGNVRCRIHGGWSKGPITPEGKAKALLNLKQNNVEKTRINTSNI